MSLHKKLHSPCKLHLPREVWMISLFLLGSACKTPMNSSGLKHQEAQFLSPYPAFNWHKVPNSRLPAYTEEAGNGPPSLILPAQESMAQHLEEMALTFDSIARKVQPEAMKQIPRPTVVIVEQSWPNAEVDIRSVCVRQRVVVGNGAAPAAPAASAAPADGSPKSVKVVDISTGSVGPLTITVPSTDKLTPLPAEYNGICDLYEPKAIGWDAAYFIDFANKSVKDSQCHLKMQGENIVVPNTPTCSAAITNETYEFVIFKAQANVVFFNSGMIEKNSEETIALFMAHELGHYYRAHSTPRYNFGPYFFIQSPDSELHRPEPTKDLGVIRDGLMSLIGLLPSHAIKGARFDRNTREFFLAPFVENFAQTYCTAERPCHEPYKAFVNFVSQSNYQKLALDAGGRELSSEGKKLYLAGEGLLVKLLESIDITEMSEEDRSQISMFLPHFLVKRFPPFAEARELMLWVEEGNRRVAGDSPQVKMLYEHAAKNGLGLYTMEEEADELAFEFVARAGMDKRDITKAWFGYWESIRSSGYKDLPLELSYEECAEMHKNGWPKKEGELYPRVLINSVEAHHHGVCYRVYNADREWEAHQYDKFLSEKPLLKFDSKRWKQLQSEMKVKLAELVSADKKRSQATDSGSEARRAPATSAGPTRAASFKAEAPACRYNAASFPPRRLSF